MKSIKPWQSIRWQLVAAFVALGGFIVVFVGVAIWVGVESIEDLAQRDAADVASLMADVLADGRGLRTGMQDYVEHLHSVTGRDFVVVDRTQTGVADAYAKELGLRYANDPGDEVGRTLRDGRMRAFVEVRGPAAGARHVVVPVRAGRAIVGAVILEYSPIRNELYAAEQDEAELIAAVGAMLVLLVALVGRHFVGRVGRPLSALQEGAARLAREDFSARVPVDAHDEFGLVGASFNRMAEQIGAAHRRLVDAGQTLEDKVAERTIELREAALASMNMMEDAIRDREEAQKSQREIEFLHSYDPLTGLANRRLFLERAERHRKAAADAAHRMALVLLDIERFRNINESHGQVAGDGLLREVARWLEQAAGDATLVARTGPDQFATVLPEVGDDEAIASFVQVSQTSLIERPFQVGDALLRIAARAGVAVHPDDGASSDELYRHAEAALKQAKAKGDRYLFYDKTLGERAAGKPTLESRLRHALEREEFVLFYQPKVDLAGDGELVGAEALIRWNDPGIGLVPPGVFIPVLEESGQILDVGRWAKQRAIADYLRWLDAGLKPPRLAVNVSALQLRKRGFAEEVKALLGVDVRAFAGLELEVTEGMVMENVRQAAATLQAIRELGVTIAIDDFGTGFSSLGYLAKLPIDTLKIDRSFVIAMDVDANGLSLVTTIINLAHALGMKVVAEGVETQDQARLLRQFRCDQLQGFLFSKPVPGDVFEQKFLRERVAFR